MSQAGAADSEEDHSTHTYMAVVLCKNILGAAWYDSACGEVRFAVQPAFNLTRV